MVLWLLSILEKLEEKDTEPIVMIALMWSQQLLIWIVKLEMSLWKDINVVFIEQTNNPKKGSFKDKKLFNYSLQEHCLITVNRLLYSGFC